MANFFTGARDNLAHLIGNPRFDLLRSEIRFPSHVKVDQISLGRIGSAYQASWR